jgi:hypothetical protein
MTTIIAISQPEMVGVSSVLRHGAGLRFWRHLSLKEALSSPLPSADLTILGGFHPTYPRLLQLISGKKALLWCSSLGEVWLEPAEQTFLKQIQALPNVDLIIFGDPEIAEVLDLKNGIHLPYPIDVERFMIGPPVERKGICLFGPPTLKKNCLNQLAAVKFVQEDRTETLYLNTPELAMLAESLKVKYRYLGWLPELDYYEQLRKMKVSLQVSYAESFGYSSLEAALLGVVPVTSYTVTWNLLKLKVENPNSPYAIADTIQAALDFDVKPLQEKIHALAHASNTAIKRWIDTLA